MLVSQQCNCKSITYIKRFSSENLFYCKGNTFYIFLLGHCIHFFWPLPPLFISSSDFSPVLPLQQFPERPQINSGQIHLFLSSLRLKFVHRPFHTVKSQVNIFFCHSALTASLPTAAASRSVPRSSWKISRKGSPDRLW